MSEITAAIKARQTQITRLQSDIETLQRATSIMGGTTKAPAKTTSQPKPKAKRKTKAKAKQKPQPKLKPKQKTRAKPKPKRHVWSAAEKKAIGKRMKAYWAKRRKAKS